MMDGHIDFVIIKEHGNSLQYVRQFLFPFF